MLNLYREESAFPRENAQENLRGRTHYASDEALRRHKAHIVDAADARGGLLFAIVETAPSLTKEPRRYYRFVIFDLFGYVINGPGGSPEYPSPAKAKAALRAALGAIDAIGETRLGIDRDKSRHAADIARLERHLERVESGAKP